MSNQSTVPRKITKIRIKDVLAIEEAEINVSNDGLKITGRTGSGKTTVLDCIKAVLDENARTKMVRQGAEHGNIVLVMSDGTTASRKISDAGAERPVVTGANGKPIGAPATFLKKLAPALLLNPVRFVNMDETEKAKVLAQAFPVELSQAELEAICGEDVDLEGVDQTANGLARASQAYKAAYVTRHSANGELKQAENSRDAERKKIPDSFDAESVRNLSSESIAQDLAKIEHQNRLISDGTNQLTKLEGESQTLNSEIDNLKRQLAEKEAQLQTVNNRIDLGREWLAKNKPLDPGPTQAILHSLDQQRMYLHCFDQAEAYEKQCKEIASRALRLDAIVAKLKALPGELVRRSNIPIEGLTLENGIVHVNGLPINNLSEGQQYRIAVRVAAASTKDLAVVCIDGAEKMTTVAREKLIDDLNAEGIQVFYTVAEECDFNVLDLEGNPADAQIKIPDRIVDAQRPKASVNKESQRVLADPRATASRVSQTVVVMHEPGQAAKPYGVPGKSGSSAPRESAPIAKPRTSLFDTAPEDEALFGEPSI
jgi:energy-coupling factor transporter ATP-binding protein EcfA2